MSEDIMLMESAGTLERGQHGLASPESPDIITHTRMCNAQSVRHQSMPLRPGVALTGYRLLATIVILGTGIPKAVYSYYGQFLISQTLDLLGGIVFGLLLFWLGVIEATSPELCPWFFQVDFTPTILRFLRRDRTPPPLPISVSHHPTFAIPPEPTAYPSTDSEDPDHPDTVTSRPYNNQPSPRTVIQRGAQLVAPNSGYLDGNESEPEVDLTDLGDEELDSRSEDMGRRTSGYLHGPIAVARKRHALGPVPDGPSTESTAIQQLARRYLFDPSSHISGFSVECGHGDSVKVVLNLEFD